MTNKAKTKAQGSRLVLPTLGIVLFLLVWLGVCTAGFWYLYVNATQGLSDPDAALAALQWMTWPFTVLAIAGPLVVVLSIGGLRVVRDLLEMQKLIINLPDQLESMQTVLSEFKTLRAQMITDVSRVRGDDNAEGVQQAPEPEDNERKPPHIVEFFLLYDEAKNIFYPALEDYNAKGAEPLIVQRGGANFSEIAESLRDKREFDPKSNENNRKVAEFVISAFELERQSRRFRAFVTPDKVTELRALRSRVRNRPRILPAGGGAQIQANA